MNNDDGTAVENMAADNDQDDIAQEHQAKNADSPGMAAKKARLRANMSKLKGSKSGVDTTALKKRIDYNTQLGATVPNSDSRHKMYMDRANAQDDSLTKIRNGAPKPQGGPNVPDDPTELEGADPSVSPMSAVSKPAFDPIASVKKAMRGAQGSGNASMLRRFNEHLKSQRSRRP